MKIVDLIILIILLLFGVIGFKRGVFKALVMFGGFVLIVVLSYQLKNYLGDFLTLNLPFINFSQFIGNASSLNIVMYQAIAFIAVLLILSLLYRFIVTISGIFEKLLRITIILGIPSKILGFIVGALEGYIIVFFGLFFLVQPCFNLKIKEKSDYTEKILSNTPILSNVAGSGLEVVNEIINLSNKDNSENFDLDLADLILKEKVTTPDVMQKLVDKKKIEIEGIDEIIEKYRKED